MEDEAPKADEAAILEAARLREVLAQANALAERALANRAAKVAAEAAACSSALMPCSGCCCRRAWATTTRPCSCVHRAMT